MAGQLAPLVHLDRHIGVVFSQILTPDLLEQIVRVGPVGVIRICRHDAAELFVLADFLYVFECGVAYFRDLAHGHFDIEPALLYALGKHAVELEHLLFVVVAALLIDVVAAP